MFLLGDCWDGFSIRHPQRCCRRIIGGFLCNHWSGYIWLHSWKCGVRLISELEVQLPLIVWHSFQKGEGLELCEFWAPGEVGLEGGYVYLAPSEVGHGLIFYLGGKWWTCECLYLALLEGGQM